ncbi:M23 family metallopeptidase [Erysipelothrix sp. HDW6A]|uniref:M23 family metallopeptidase n=1 Tax=Erysipelothrix sp. HDW6A TaxID=2714928 RepID=UPI0014089B09|nr:M23 family metallopeptidase [Erysipelothrix sp. HDW6A]QIK57021.1 M23 family metallopeptidase [Erysipelothrix sp. HDW6A]
MKKALGGVLGGAMAWIIVPLVFIMLVSSSLSQTTSGIYTGEDGKAQSLFEVYYKGPIFSLQKEKDVLVPFAWLYGAMWFNDPDNITEDKIETLIEKAYTCDEGCKLVELDTYIDNIRPILHRQDVDKATIKKNIELFLDSDVVYYGELPTKLSDYKGLEMALPLHPEVFYVSERFGLYDPFNKNEWEMHRAVDLAPYDRQEGHELYSMIDGVVSGKGYSNDYGYYIIIQSSKHSEFKFRYAHMQRASDLVLGMKLK